MSLPPIDLNNSADNGWGVPMLLETRLAVALLASASFDRLSPALGLTIAFVVVSYFLDVLGSLWPDAKGLQPWSVFHYLNPKAILTGLPDTGDLAVLAAVAVVAVAAALWIFPRRDLAAPS